MITAVEKAKNSEVLTKVFDISLFGDQSTKKIPFNEGRTKVK